MEHENELKEALDFVSPSALTYDEWLMVGMALKDSGLPVTLWEQWSTRDAGRYHKGECVKKWEAFTAAGPAPSPQAASSSWPTPTDGAARRATLWTGTMIFLPAPAHKPRAVW